MLTSARAFGVACTCTSRPKPWRVLRAVPPHPRRAKVESLRANATQGDSAFVTANGCKLRVRVSGDGTSSKPPVLLLHGFPDTGALWSKQVTALTAAGYKVIVPDMPGFGESDKPTDVASYKTENVVGILIALLKELKVDKFCLVGHDWGAALAWSLAVALPQRVDKLAVLSVGWPGGLMAAEFTQRDRSWYTLFFLFPDAEELLMANGWALMRRFIEDQCSEEQLEEYLTRLAAPGALTAGLNVYRATVSPQFFGTLELVPPPGGQKLDMPVLGLWSTGDDKFLAEAGMKASADVVAPGRWRYERVEASSHWMMLAEPEKVDHLLLDFLNEAK